MDRSCESKSLFTDPEEGEEDEATMELLKELSTAGFELYKPTMDNAGDDDESIPAWVLALVGEGAATVDSSPATEEEPAVVDSELASRMEEAEDVVDSGRSAMEMAMEMSAEEEEFASYRSDWESRWGADGWGYFCDMTTVSSMQYTHLTPSVIRRADGIVDATLQIFSIKLAEIKGGLEWPLSVYGVVAARDAVDHNRNLLFCRDRRCSQKIKQHDPFLCLTGPSRAIVLTVMEPVVFEIQLKVQGKTASEDRALISATSDYTRVGRGRGVRTICFENCFCTAEICVERVSETVQATIFGVRVVKGGSEPFEYGCRVACHSPSGAFKLIDGKVTYVASSTSPQVVLFDSRCRGMLKGFDGYYIDLSRQVVSVELEGSLKVVVDAYSSSGDIAAQGHVSFTPETCNVSRERFYVGDAQVEVSVAWSLLVSDKRDIALEGWVSEFSTM
ncbi:hypothetical protein QYE76_011122 [Lolium multiflorum]|uniref:DUF6598 domain-containing protein n=1 Tax=Lolium multiflorum TaxID=4521 RepID=A0AAD8TYL7_LOLMU|nr:hypothetical protein QYE76_011122 [Lolium multiflorum]